MLHKINETQHKITETQHKIIKTQHKIIETQHKILADRSGKPRYESMKTRPVSNMAMSEVETPTAPVLVKENHIPKASLSFNGSLELGSEACEAVCLYRMTFFT